MEARRSRVEAVDLLRGIVMVIMALDHTRDYLHVGAQHFSPEDLTKTTTAIFLTRWITHFCAPVFMFTAGLGACFYGRRGRGELVKFLLTRGLWLMLLELTVLRFAYSFSMTEGMVLVTVLWALGLSMVVLSGLVFLPAPVLAVVSVGMIVGHNLLDRVQAAQFGSHAWVWNVLHQTGVFKVGSVLVLLAYPLIPWAGVMAAGYCLGPVLQLEEGRRRRVLVSLGLGLMAAFVVIRGLNGYGDPGPWIHGQGVKTVLSFLRTNKYPPSLDYLLMTLGPALVVLGLLGGKTVSRRNPLLVFGRVPLFYFLGHIFAIHLLAVVLSLVRYGTVRYGITVPPSMGAVLKFPPDYGYSLGAVYGFWLLIVVVMYPLCLWFAGVKERRRSWWLGYL